MQQLLILAGFILVGGLGIVIWLRITDDWAERDRWRRFEEAMRHPSNQPNRYLDDDERRP